MKLGSKKGGLAAGKEGQKERKKRHRKGQWKTMAEGCHSAMNGH